MRKYNYVHHQCYSPRCLSISPSTSSFPVSLDPINLSHNSPKMTQSLKIEARAKSEKTNKKTCISVIVIESRPQRLLQTDQSKMQ